MTRRLLSAPSPSDSTVPSPVQPTRRAVLGAAWAAPVVVLAAAAPFAAASTGFANSILVDPSSRTVIGPTKFAVTGVLTQDGGTLPTAVTVDVATLAGTGTLTITPQSPTLAYSGGTGSFSFEVDPGPGYAGDSQFTVTVTPQNDSTVTFAPGGNTTLVSVVDV